MFYILEIQLFIHQKYSPLSIHDHFINHKNVLPMKTLNIIITDKHYRTFKKLVFYLDYVIIFKNILSFKNFLIQN